MRTLQVFHSSIYRRRLFLRGLVVVIGALITSRALTLLKKLTDNGMIKATDGSVVAIAF